MIAEVQLNGVGGSEYERLKAQMLLIRITLGLNPIHDVVEAVRVLHNDGKGAFEQLRGERCEYAHQWHPH